MTDVPVRRAEMLPDRPARRSAPATDVTRESFVLPVLFLTVGLAGGFRAAPGGQLRLLPPSLIALVLAVLLIGLLVRSGALLPSQLLSVRRTALENLSGGILLGALFFAGAQVFNLVTPEAGLLHVLFTLFYAVLLWNTLAAAPDRQRLLRSLFVVFGGAFVLKFIVLAALSEPGQGLAKRVLAILLEGVSLGTLEYELHAPLTGYAAFFTIALYMVGLILLPTSLREDSRIEGSLTPSSSYRTLEGSNDRILER